MSTHILVKNIDGGVTPLGGVGDAAKVFLASLLAGEDQFLNGIGVFAAGSEYVAGAGVTSGTDITLGAIGAAGDLLEEVVLRNASAASATLSIIDGSTTIEAYTTTVAAGATARVPVGLRAKNAGWKIDITSGGTMSSIHYCATGSFS